MLYTIMHHLQNHTLPVMKINVFQNLLPWVLLRAQFKKKPLQHIILNVPNYFLTIEI